MSGQINKVYEADLRRRWSEEEKQAIIEESKTSPVARVAKKHGVAVSLLFRWRKLQGIGSRRTAAPSGFVHLALPAPAKMNDGAREHTIEIVLASGRRVIVGQDVDAVALKRVIAALEA